MRTDTLLSKSIMLVEIVQRVRTMGEGDTKTYLILICNHLELVPKCSASVEDAQADSTTSDEELSKNQAEGLGGEVLYRNPQLTFYITGKQSHRPIEVS